MAKEILLALAHNASTQLNNEIVELSDDIRYLENELSIKKDKNFHSIVKGRFHARKKERCTELNVFFSKYIMFLMDSRKNETNSLYESQKGSMDEGKLMQNLSREKKGDIHLLKDMYLKRDTLKEIFNSLRIRSIERMSDEQSQMLFSDLVSKLGNMNGGDDVARRDVAKRDIAKHSVGNFSKLLKGNGERIPQEYMLHTENGVREGRKQFLHYLQDIIPPITEQIVGVSVSPPTAPQTVSSNTSSTAPSTAPSAAPSAAPSTAPSAASSTAASTVSLIDLNSERESDSEQVNSFPLFVNVSDDLEEVGNVLPKEEERHDKREIFNEGENLPLHYSVFEKRKSPDLPYNTKNESLSKFLLNRKIRANSRYTLVSKFNVGRKFFSNSEQKLVLPPLRNDKLTDGRITEGVTGEVIAKRDEDAFRGEETAECDYGGDVNGVGENERCYANVQAMGIQKVSNNEKRSYRTEEKIISLSPNGGSKSVCAKNDTQRSNKKGETQHRSGSPRLHASASDGASYTDSDTASSASSPSEWGSQESRFEKPLRRKRYVCKINKKGRGSFAVRKEGDKSSVHVYDFEVIYEDSEMEKCKDTCKTQENKKIFHFSFLKRGNKIKGVKNLYITDGEIVKEIHLETERNSYEQQVQEDGKTLQSNKKERNKMGKEWVREMCIMEENIKTLKEENFRRKYELTRVIEDIKNRKKKSSNEIGLEIYNMEFVETNRLRGLYIHMIDKQCELEREKNFYKKELKKLQEDVKNNTSPLDEFLKEEKEKFLEKEKLFYKKEKKFLKKQNVLKTKIIKLENELEITKEKLMTEKELNKNLCDKILDNKIIIEKNENEKITTEKVNESKIKSLNCERDKLIENITYEKKENEKLKEELSILKKDNGFDNFRKVILEKILKTNGDIKYLAEILELLTNELENKICKENENNKKLHELKENFETLITLLNRTKKKLTNEKKRSKKLCQKISYLNEKNENLAECIQILSLQCDKEGNKSEKTRIPNGVKTENTDDIPTKQCIHPFSNSDKRTCKMLLYNNDRSNSNESDGCSSSSTVYWDETIHCGITHLEPGMENNSKRRRGSTNYSRSCTDFSDKSSLFLCNNGDTKKGGYSLENLEGSSGESVPIYRGMVKHGILL
ncbi:hypothetical protein, conserved [Plasmodium ovale wallikeri]|uniref:Uncharacterized protein n=2 Tax=Plasmodium ovale TaxID=36330 RepID=A0A1A9AJX6_PLAOA|nr:hypothetical protein, conserved [Plasmodium ovale wallikeri]SBT56486.1 hypothetical protein, conserved [Plasmodium ovale wallikeri]SBT76335.1 conserved Plasmodium protein, unknown function [Plasmodium ovale]